MAGNILIVDHSTANRDLLQWALRREGYAVTLASDHGTGLCFVRDNRFDLVITGRDDAGSENAPFSARVRAMAGNNDLPILVLSGIEQQVGGGTEEDGTLAWMENAGELEQMLEMVASLIATA